ncbi:MAG TPA: beta-galactosidase [Bryobacteraceae bacterium]|nr:beta-galactosidase [Bryobacteraceae bacterium]
MSDSNSKTRFAVLALALLALSAMGPTLAWSATRPALLLGAAWYPEQWPESRWEADLQLMEAAHIHVVRVGEFAWSRLEPREGQFDLGWLERAVNLAGKHGIAVVLGTPSAAPPAWLTQKYPETLRTEENGRKAEHGNRQQASATSERYRELSRRITEQMARRFGHNPNVIGWQIDNEYGVFSFDEGTRRQFQNWLREKYGTLANLNQHWTTEYWSQSYTDWSQIPMEPYGNPGLALEFKHFVTAAWRDFQDIEVQAIRANSDPRQFITSNFMGWYDAFDHYVLSRELDLASWDDYVGTGQLKVFHNAATHDLTRGFKNKNFWVMETQPGFVNWAPVNNALDRGEVREMAWQAIGHGADAVSYWQWRSALNGQEEYHGTLVGADGTPVPLYAEVTQIGREFEQASDALAGTSPVSDVALLHTYDSRWAIDLQRHNDHFDPVNLLLSYYQPVREMLQQVDIIGPDAPLAPYRLVIAPGLNVLPDDLADKLRAYVEGGGHLVLGPRSGMKDAYNGLQPARQPGPLVPLLGGRVEQFYALDKDVPVAGEWGKGKASLWAEQLKASAADAEVPLRYGESNGWLDGQPAVISRAVGKGRITYIGAWLDDGLMRAATEWMIRLSNLKPAFGPVPDGVEVMRRTGAGREVFILVNHTKAPQTVALPRSMRRVLHNGEAANSVELPARGVEVLD